MTDWTVRPSRVAGSVRAPPSKSYTHRALVAGASMGIPLAIERPLSSDDTLATALGILRLGFPLVLGNEHWTLGTRPRGARTKSPARINCGESGSTLRFLAPLAARASQPCIFDGSPRLRNRPILPLLESLRSLGANVDSIGRRNRLPVRIEGPLRAGEVRVSASETSQFASGLMMALAGLDAPSRLVLEGPVVSRPYLEATARTLQFVGAAVRRRGRGFEVGGKRRRRAPGAFRVPGDASSAAYLWTAASVTGGDVTVEGIETDWPQADLQILPLLRSVGSRVRRRASGFRVRGRAHTPFRVDLTDAPDLVPLAGVLAAGIPGRSIIEGAPQLVHKESDRRTGSARLARELGAAVRLSSNQLEVRGTRRTHGLGRTRWTDHRMVLSALVGALGSDQPSRIGRLESVAKSYPMAAADFRSLGADLLGGAP